MKTDYHHYSQIATQVAKQAGSFLLEKFGQVLQVERKSLIDLVTDVDRASEQLIRDQLLSVFSDHAMLGEEDGLYGDDKSNPLWIVDPLDGTTNYASGFPVFCVSIALEIEGQIVVGIVYDPNRDELFCAVRGKGATLNGAPIHVAAVNCLDDAVVGTGFPYDRRSNPDDNLNNFAMFMKNCRGVRRIGSAALDMAYVASGRMAGFWELRLGSWDTAAGWLLLEEAGAVVTDIFGAPYHHTAASVLGSNPILHPQMLELLKKARHMEPLWPGNQ